LVSLNEHHSYKQMTGLILFLTWGWSDLNRRPPAPEAGIIPS
jgi:hypothetical protein